MKYRHKREGGGYYGGTLWGKIQMMEIVLETKDWSCGGCGGQITVLSA